MLLIDTESLKLESIVYPAPGSYAILSHTWGKEEINFQEWKCIESGAGGADEADRLKQKSGYAKIEMTCRMAKADGLKYAWVDTVCIDKSSSAELSEAINSMFKWYRDSHICYAYLSDLENASDLTQLQASRWFTRGWTLQELIAPQRVRFYDKWWVEAGTKAKFQELLAKITQIDPDVLVNGQNLDFVPVGRRMSWAAARETSRVEDIAYCLLGIFNVNMPLLYGEGDRAFLRLQEEILKEHNDLSLFAWQNTSGKSLYRGIFAESPSEFSDCVDLKAPHERQSLWNEVSVTSNGLRAEGIFPPGPPGRVDRCILDLGCCRKGATRNPEWLFVQLLKVGETFVRVLPKHITAEKSRRLWWQGTRRTVYVRKSVQGPQQLTEANCRISNVTIQFAESLRRQMRLCDVLPRQHWEVETTRFGVESAHFVGIVPFVFETPPPAPRLQRRLVLLCGVHKSFIRSWRLDSWAAIFQESGPNDELSTALVALAHGDDASLLEEHRQNAVKDMLFANFSATYGVLRGLDKRASVTIEDHRNPRRRQYILSLETHDVAVEHTWRATTVTVNCEVMDVPAVEKVRSSKAPVKFEVVEKLDHPQLPLVSIDPVNPRTSAVSVA
ncbi:uncharacterized protein Z520_11809 [Fonsecaea multimorphosa CBS 102226]|uniref:Uncharacterized protein n=1 Tax=Fonsecaea multimorphosa CBS 102226 TaxID=1442371 RepID=A0A0D2JPT7_9EURO|nr:uncharacterized protein Z520_11809 [Fonsecaea multimorphosa CBS 102226]KIX92489.1 hypothetical protein Z520_11809 [Fonsecaea multimorphosa CBS 102226]OAL19602.1 hypothetical protein AYO22_09764 [Fonsecaea multimorphosa]